MNFFFVDWYGFGSLEPSLAGQFIAPVGQYLGAQIMEFHPLIRKQKISLVGYEDGVHIANIASSVALKKVSHIYALAPSKLDLEYIYKGLSVAPNKSVPAL